MEDKTYPHDNASLPAAAEIGRDSLAAIMLPGTKTCAAANMPSTVASACHACAHIGIYIHRALKFILSVFLEQQLTIIEKPSIG